MRVAVIVRLRHAAQYATQHVDDHVTSLSHFTRCRHVSVVVVVVVDAVVTPLLAVTRWSPTFSGHWVVVECPSGPRRRAVSVWPASAVDVRPAEDVDVDDAACQQRQARLTAVHRIPVNGT